MNQADSNTNIKISILVPIYNVERYLKECLESLINQTLDDIEIICINDGSTDGSLRILEEYSKKDLRIKVINKENSGYGASMNVGLAAARGEYIGIVESDDFVENDMYEKLYNIAIKNDCDIVKSDFYDYQTSDKSKRKAGKVTNKFGGKPFSLKDDVMILKIMPTIWSAIYKKEFIDNNNIKFLETSGASYQDTSFAFKTFSLAKRIVFTSKAYINYRKDNINSSVKSKNKVFAICEEYKEITKFFNEHPEIKSIANGVKLSTQFNAYIWNTKRVSKEFRDAFIDVFQAEFKEFWENGEITKDFYKKVKPKTLKMLLNDKKAFRKYVDDLAIKQQKRYDRHKRFSVRINSSRISIVLFGKQLLEIG